MSEKTNSAGFTLIELMFAVVILGILVAVSVVAYTKNIRKARSGEVPVVIGELKTREEAWYAEHGYYLGVCHSPSGSRTEGDCQEGQYWPDLAGKGQAVSAVNLPDRWRLLRINVSSALYCQYEVIAGKAGDSQNIGSLGTEMFPSTPARNWYYVLARCDWDGDRNTNEIYWQRDDWNQFVRTGDLN